MIHRFQRAGRRATQALSFTACAAGATSLLLGLRPPLRASDAAPLVHEVRMVRDGDAYRFQPSTIQLAPGDSVAFVVESGEPHNVAFDTTGLQPSARQWLAANLPDAIAPFVGPILVRQGARYVVGLGDAPAGRYSFVCLPHAHFRMQGTAVVTRPAAGAP